MKITELLIEICIFVLVTMCFLQAYSFVNRNENKIKQKIEKSNFILETDSKIRDEIWQIKNKYWEHSDLYIDIAKNKLMNFDLGEDCKILSIDEFTDEQKRPSGLIVVWSYKNKVVTTKESFSFRVIIE